MNRTRTVPIRNASTLRAAAAGLALLAALVAHPAAAGATDSVTTKGRTYLGDFEFWRDDEVEFVIEAVDKTADIDTEDVTDLHTETPRLVLYGATGSALGRLAGIHDGSLAVEDRDGAVLRVPVDQIVAISDPGDNFASRFLRRHLRYWSGRLDLGTTATQATTSTVQFLASISGKRVQGDTELNVSASYRYGRQKEQGEDVTTNLDEIIGAVDFRYTFGDQLFTFGEMQGTYDAIQFLSLRTQPFAGVGYDLIDTDDANLAAKLGVGWIYERYFGGAHEEYTAVSFALSSEWDLPWEDATFTGSVSYRPALRAWTTNYLIQSKAEFDLPVTSLLSVTVSVRDDYNNQPSEDATRNSFYFNFGVSVKL